MNSFESLVKGSKGTPVARHFTPFSDDLLSRIEYTEEIILDLVEMFGEEFLNWKDDNDQHIGFRSASNNIIPILLEKCGDAAAAAAFINHTDNNGQHMGFYIENKEQLNE